MGTSWHNSNIIVQVIHPQNFKEQILFWTMHILVHVLLKYDGIEISDQHLEVGFSKTVVWYKTTFKWWPHLKGPKLNYGQ